MQQKLQTTFIIHFCLSVTIFALYDFRVRPASASANTRTPREPGPQIMEHSERRAEVTQQVAATCCAVETSSCQHLGQRFFVLITRKLAGKGWGAGVGPPRRLALADGRRTWVGNSRNRKQTCGRATTTSCKQAAVNGYKHKKARSGCQKQKQQQHKHKTKSQRWQAKAAKGRPGQAKARPKAWPGSCKRLSQNKSDSSRTPFSLAALCSSPNGCSWANRLAGKTSLPVQNSSE